MLGYDSADELLGADIRTVAYRDPAEHVTVLARLAAGELRDWAEVRWRMKDGTPIAVRLAIHAVRDDDDALEGYEVIAEDVTERQRR